MAMLYSPEPVRIPAAKSESENNGSTQFNVDCRIDSFRILSQDALADKSLGAPFLSQGLS